MRVGIFISFLSFAANAVTLDHFECMLRYQRAGASEMFEAQSAFWVIRYPGSCQARENIRENIRENSYCMSYASSAFTVEAADGALEARLLLTYKHAVQRSSSFRAAQWVCLSANARINNGGEQASLKASCEPHGSDPFNVKDPNWVPVAHQKGVPQFHSQGLAKPIVIVSTELASELRVECKFLETRTSQR